MAYVYKILMNSLYGRFGINPESTTTEVCDRARYDELIQKDNFIWGDKLSDHTYIVSYLCNASHVSDLDWNPPKISAVQMAAAITACARIHMYKYISRDDCYYTDTDSAILGSPLPEDEISMELGKLKLEHFVKEGIFLAPKSYGLDADGEYIVKHKGLGKHFVDYESSPLADERFALTDADAFSLEIEADPLEADRMELLDKKEKESAQKDAQLDVLAHQIAGLYDQNASLKEQIESIIKSNQAKEDIIDNLMKSNNDKFQMIDSLTKLTEKRHYQINKLIEMNRDKQEQNEILIKMNQDKQERIDGLSKMLDDQAKATLNYHARLFEDIQELKKLIQDKDAQLDDLREMNASLIKRKNEEIDRLEAKPGQTTKLPTQDTHKPKEPSWWKDKERMRSTLDQRAAIMPPAG